MRRHRIEAPLKRCPTTGELGTAEAAPTTGELGTAEAAPSTGELGTAEVPYGRVQ
jgi:hypothetical protein